MASEACSHDASLLYRKRDVLKKLYYRSIHPTALRLLRGASLLEYPYEYLDALDSGTADHHFGEWDEIYRSLGEIKPEYDLWLEKYAHILETSTDTPIVDLGCGYGNNTLFLYERGYKVISCDLSMEALKRLRHFIRNPVIRHFDMLAGLPFDNGSAKIIIADLSIHYFLWSDTERLVQEIRRVLINDGYLFCRVNSTVNMRTEAGNGSEIEENYYDIGGRKRDILTSISLNGFLEVGIRAMLMSIPLKDSDQQKSSGK